MITTILLASVITIIFLYVMYENYKLKKSLTHVENMYEQLRTHFYKVQKDYVELMKEKKTLLK